jgi:hypothetical protein
VLPGGFNYSPDRVNHNAGLIELDKVTAFGCGHMNAVGAAGRQVRLQIAPDCLQSLPILQ